MPPRTPIAATLLTVHTGSGEPIYRQIMAQVRRLIAAGQLTAGDTLPSVREVADTFAVNPMTVSKAYGLLEAAGVLERQRGVGMAVAQGTPAARGIRSRLALLQPTLQRAAAEAAQLDIPADEALAAFARLLKEGRR